MLQCCGSDSAGQFPRSDRCKIGRFACSCAQGACDWCRCVLFTRPAKPSDSDSVVGVCSAGGRFGARRQDATSNAAVTPRPFLWTPRVCSLVLFAHFVSGSGRRTAVVTALQVRPWSTTASGVVARFMDRFVSARHLASTTPRVWLGCSKCPECGLLRVDRESVYQREREARGAGRFSRAPDDDLSEGDRRDASRSAGVARGSALAETLCPH